MARRPAAAAGPTQACSVHLPATQCSGSALRAPAAAAAGAGAPGSAHRQSPLFLVDPRGGIRMRMMCATISNLTLSNAQELGSVHKTGTAQIKHLRGCRLRLSGQAQAHSHLKHNDVVLSDGDVMDERVALQGVSCACNKLKVLHRRKVLKDRNTVVASGLQYARYLDVYHVDRIALEGAAGYCLAWHEQHPTQCRMALGPCGCSAGGRTCPPGQTRTPLVA